MRCLKVFSFIGIHKSFKSAQIFVAELWQIMVIKMCHRHITQQGRNTLVMFTFSIPFVQLNNPYLNIITRL